MDTKEVTILVKRETGVVDLSTSITKFIRSNTPIRVKFMGETATNQAIKAMARVRDHLLHPENDEPKLDVSWIISWTKIVGIKKGDMVSCLEAIPLITA